MLDIERIHHVSLPVTDLARSREFYGEVLGLLELPRPPFPFPGAWYQLGDGQLHLIVAERPTLRVGKGIDSHDIHVAIRVRSYRQALDHLRARGYRSDAEDELRRMRENPNARAGFPQLYILDPDRHVIEINAAALD